MATLAQIVVAIPPTAAYERQSAVHLAELLTRSPCWQTSTVSESGEMSLPAGNVDVLILHSPTDRQLPRDTIRITRLVDFEITNGNPASHPALPQSATNSYFACTSEKVREALLAVFPASRHCVYVVPTSLENGVPAATNSENELAHWQELIRFLTRRIDIPSSSPVRVTSVQPREIQSTCPLTVVISSEGMDERLINCLDRIVPQLDGVGAELLVGIKVDPGAAASRWPQARFFHEPAANVLSLRAKCISMAKGQVIAIMEDHGLPGKDWCQRVVDLHRKYPSTPILYGPVMHGGPFGITSWANFLVNYGLFMPPLHFPPRRRVPPIVGTTIKRSYLPEGDLEEGWFEFIDMPKFHDLELCRSDESLLVRHIQHHGFIGTYQAHYHNARVTTGSRKLVKDSPTWKDQLKNSFRVPRQLIGIDWKEIWSLKRRRGLLLKTLPCYVGIVFAHTIGEIVGLYFGPGRSADHID